MELLKGYKDKWAINYKALKEHLATKESGDFHNIFVFCLSCVPISLAGVIWGCVYLAAGTSWAFWLPWIYSTISIINLIVLYFIAIVDKTCPLLTI